MDIIDVNKEKQWDREIDVWNTDTARIQWKWFAVVVVVVERKLIEAILNYLDIHLNTKRW